MSSKVDAIRIVAVKTKASQKILVPKCNFLGLEALYGVHETLAIFTSL